MDISISWTYPFFPALSFPKHNCNRYQWLMSVILDTWETKIRRIVVWGRPRQKVSKTPSQPIAQGVGMCLSPQTT
jgi:hypothetical protein